MSSNIQIDTTNEGRIGVNAIGLAFEKMGWTFRERTHSDFGIDADVEQKCEGVRTNRHIALQIKSGESYIKIKKNGKITFSIDTWHYNYWLQSDRPVIILMYDPETENIYWEQVKLVNIQKGPKSFKIEIDATKVLDDNSLQEFNEIIDTFVKHTTYKIDTDLINFDYSITCVEEYSAAVKDLVSKLEQFRTKLQSHFPNPKTERLCCQLDVLGIDIKNHIENDYALLHKACWYLAFLAYNINIQDADKLVKELDNYINILLIQKASWLTIIDNFKRLIHPNIPKKIQRSNSKVITYIENYTALINLSIEDFIACKIIIESRTNGQTEDAKP